MIARVFVFLGVTTSQSSIMRIFPRWRDRLGLGADVEIVGWDVPIGAPPARYQELVSAMKVDGNIVGGLVTTHKLDVYAAARDLIDDLDPYARLCEEVSCLSKRGDRLLGWAKDPVSAGRSLTALLGSGYFLRTGGKVLCFGAGGAGTAIVLHLLTALDPGDRPEGIMVTDAAPGRLDSLRTLHRKVGSTIPIDLVEVRDPLVNDALLDGLPPGSLVINATGMGKDIPGSPITAAARFPERGIVWELNYRGDLHFLRQAAARSRDSGLRLEAGWSYFIHGWTTAIEEVFQRPIGTEELDRLTEAAAFARPPLPIAWES
ncbi:MAG: shikimate dehydrogenase family protein [Chloroflexota bacterium]